MHIQSFDNSCFVVKAVSREKNVLLKGCFMPFRKFIVMVFEIISFVWQNHCDGL